MGIEIKNTQLNQSTVGLKSMQKKTYTHINGLHLDIFQGGYRCLVVGYFFRHTCVCVRACTRVCVE